jgi:hypothetical protein
MASMFPPNGEITPDNCEAVLTEAFSVKPFGPWVDAVEQGLVEYDGTATRQCLDTLDEATCAEGPEGFTSEVAAALYDAGCLAFTPPLGGLEQRSMFTRTASSGQCLPLTDGNGGAVYGTCDPQTSFCCVAGDTPGSCFFSSAAEEGQCVPASASGQACFLDVVEQDAQFCRTGLECSDYETGECFEPPQPMPMQIGDVCYDSQTFTVIGECVGGYCDLFDTEQCVALIDDGEACEGAEQCEGGACLDGMCGQSPFCTGVE